MRIEDELGNVALGGNTGVAITPDSYLDDTLQSSMKAVQARFEKQWGILQANAEYMGVDKANAMLTQLTIKGKEEIVQLQMQAQQKRDMIKRLTLLRDQGQLPGNADEMLWEIAAGPDVARAMFPKIKEQAPIDPIDEYRDLTQQEERIQKDLERFHVVPGGEQQNRRFLPDWGMPVSTSKLQVFDPEREVRVKKQGKWVKEIGAWVDSPAPSKHAKEMASLNKQLALVRDAKQRLRQSPAIGSRIRNASARLITGENPHGTLGDKVSASVVLRQTNRTPTKGKKLDRATAQAILQEAKGNKSIARQIARERGYEL